MGARLIPSNNTFSLLSEFGFTYNSVLMDRDDPYVITNGKSGRKIVELAVTFSFNDTAYFVYTFRMAKPLLTPRMVEEVYRDEFDELYKENGYCMFMLHPQIIGRPHRLSMLERTISYMENRGDVWFTTAGEVVAYVRSTLPS